MRGTGRNCSVFGPSALLLVLAIVAGCEWGSALQPRPFALSRAHVDEISPRRDDHLDGFLSWAADQTQMIIIDKASRKLVLYEKGEPVKTYSVVLGRNPGRKVFEGDRRTPSGLYEITDKRRSGKYGRFLALDYPNADDLANYRSAAARGLLPRGAGDSRRGPGGLVGIHGTDKQEFNSVGINWTFGCISLANRDVEELYSLVDRGTLVVIRDDQQP